MNRGAVAGVAADVRSGSKADLAAGLENVRFARKSGHEAREGRALKNL